MTEIPTHPKFTIQGNEINGYAVVQLVEGEYRFITKRYDTYDEACRSLDTILEDNEEEK